MTAPNAEPLAVLILSTGADTARTGRRIEDAFARHAPGWSVREVHTTATYIDPDPPRWSPDRTAGLWRGADVVHLRNTFDGYDRYGRYGHRPLVLHHHGSVYRAGHGRIAARARSLAAVEMASTIDLTLLEPGVRWMPAPFHLGTLRELRTSTWAPRSAVRVLQAPTSRSVKSTEVVLGAVRELRRRGLDVEMDLVEDVVWEEVLVRKAAADVVVDQLVLGYGNNAVEAWAMGVPVVANAADPRVLDAMRARFGELPFFRATEENLADRLELLVRSPERRAEWGERGRAHAERFHDEERVVPLLQEAYHDARRGRAA